MSSEPQAYYMGLPVDADFAARATAEPNPARALQNMFEGSDKWGLNAWTESALIVSRAALKHMLVKIEGELGRRKLIAPLRNRNS
ncbi:MAG TPA: hypothetical protein VK878_23250 [Candidatus Deferrimicrobiaceae bacterium]|nr:hypothetical protein [Candidatus Deferrimicrobiaceae bacterium]